MLAIILNVIGMVLAYIAMTLGGGLFTWILLIGCWICISYGACMSGGAIGESDSCLYRLLMLANIGFSVFILIFAFSIILTSCGL